MYKCDLYTFIRLSKNRHRPDKTPQGPPQRADRPAPENLGKIIG